jgi:hypothetical protein
MECPGSAYLEASCPNDTFSAYAQTGTEAHKVAENILLAANPLNAKYPAGFEAVKIYVDYCIDEYNRLKALYTDAQLIVEKRVDFSFIVPGGFGTADFIAAGGCELSVVDLKFGSGVKVSAKDNPQLRLYAIGALACFIDRFPIQSIKYSIVQPRIKGKKVSSETTNTRELLSWGVNYVYPKAMQAFAGVAVFKEGAHCRFCKAFNKCNFLR